MQSESLGLVRSRDGQFLLTKYTRKWNFFFQALCKWLENHYPTDVDERFPFTTTSLNLDFAARRCRDANNAGPSISNSFGEFSTGFLKHWPNDDGTQELDELADADAQIFDTRTNLILLDGERAHAASDNEGEWYSLVFFTINAS